MSQSKDLSRRDVVKAAGAATIIAAARKIEGAPAIQKVKAANDQVQFGMIGTGSRGTYLLKHLKSIDNGRCVALCDINAGTSNEASKTIGNNPKTFKDYRELLAQKDVEAVFVTTPLFVHFPITRDALQAGKHVFCEKCLVFKPEEVHALRALAAEHPKQILQTGLQRRYSYFYQTVKQMVDKGILGNVHHIHAQWHRNMINKPSSLWTMKPGGEKQHRQLARLPLDVGRPDGGADLAPGGRGGLDVRLVARVRDGPRQPGHAEGRPRRLRQHPVDLQISEGPEADLLLDQHQPVPAVLQRLARRRWARSSWAPTARSRSPWATTSIRAGPIAWWYREPPRRSTVTKAGEKKKKRSWRAPPWSLAGGANGPIPIMTSDLDFTGKESFLDKRSEVRAALADLEGRDGAGRAAESGGHRTGELLPELPRRARRRRPTWKSAWPIRWR